MTDYLALKRLQQRQQRFEQEIIVMTGILFIMSILSVCFFVGYIIGVYTS